MRLIILTVSLASGLGLGLFRASAELEVSAGVSIHATSDFYEPLAPLGTWVEVGSYGRCWHPAGVAAGWRPYCNGDWEWTNCGWYWVSNDPWAWACYHYGAWIYDPGVGWCWVPGIEWAPAWVCWRTGDDYIGWAPCGPAGFIVEPSFYVFVESRYFHDPIRPDTVIVNNLTVIKNTTEIKAVVGHEKRQFDGKSQAVVVNEGPSVDMVQKATGHKFTAVSVQEADRQTFASVPEKLKHRPPGTATNEKPHTVQAQPNPASVGTPSQPPPSPLTPAIPSGNSGSHNQGQDRDKNWDKDHGPDNP